MKKFVVFFCLTLALHIEDGQSTAPFAHVNFKVQHVKDMMGCTVRSSQCDPIYINSITQTLFDLAAPLVDSILKKRSPSVRVGYGLSFIHNLNLQNIPIKSARLDVKDLALTGLQNIQFEGVSHDYDHVQANLTMRDLFVSGKVSVGSGGVRLFKPVNMKIDEMTVFLKLESNDGTHFNYDQMKIVLHYDPIAHFKLNLL